MTDKTHTVEDPNTPSWRRVWFWLAKGYIESRHDSEGEMIFRITKKGRAAGVRWKDETSLEQGEAS